MARGSVAARGARGIVTARGVRGVVAARGARGVVAGGTRGRGPATRGGRQNADSFVECGESTASSPRAGPLGMGTSQAGPSMVGIVDGIDGPPSKRRRRLIPSAAAASAAFVRGYATDNEIADFLCNSSEDEDDEDPEYGEVGPLPVLLSRSERMFLGEEADEVPPTGI
ncbi:unnamed protein product [Parnassius apollo]|uniref:(apollo) hypothetical protein n=1 Tax=Parnassius apollo TaxID=110799 RepID=A0A8S3XW32_PARAO|nr:unnamed protein product [Parnassius apollo]